MFYLEVRRIESVQFDQAVRYVVLTRDFRGASAPSVCVALRVPVVGLSRPCANCRHPTSRRLSHWRGGCALDQRARWGRATHIDLTRGQLLALQFDQQRLASRPVVPETSRVHAPDARTSIGLKRDNRVVVLNPFDWNIFDRVHVGSSVDLVHGPSLSNTTDNSHRCTVAGARVFPACGALMERFGALFPLLSQIDRPPKRQKPRVSRAFVWCAVRVSNPGPAD